MTIPRNAFFRTRTGLWFLPMFDVAEGLRITAFHGRGRRWPVRLQIHCRCGVAGFMIRGPKEWCPGGDPAGFDRSVEILKGDRLTLHFDGRMLFQSFDEPGCFGIVREPSPLYEALMTVRT